MNPELVQWMEASMQAILDQGGTEADIMDFLRSEGINTREQWLRVQSGGPRFPAVERAEQPPFPNLSPNVGALVDMLTAMAAPVVAGGPSTPRQMREQALDAQGELMQRAPGATAAASAIPAVGAAGMARSMAMTAANPHGFHIARSAPGVASFAKRALQNRIIQNLGAGGAGAALSRLFDR